MSVKIETHFHGGGANGAKIRADSVDLGDNVFSFALAASQVVDGITHQLYVHFTDKQIEMFADVADKHLVAIGRREKDGTPTTPDDCGSCPQNREYGHRFCKECGKGLNFND